MRSRQLIQSGGSVQRRFGLRPPLNGLLPADQSALVAAARMGAVVGLMLGLPACGGCGAASPAASQPGAGTVFVAPSVLDFGTVDAGARLTGEVTVRNETAAEVRIERIASSCDCLTVTPSSFALSVGSEQLLLVDVDMSNDAEFLGLLGIEVEGLDANGNRAFQFEVSLAVTNPAP